MAVSCKREEEMQAETAAVAAAAREASITKTQLLFLTRLNFIRNNCSLKPLV